MKEAIDNILRRINHVCEAIGTDTDKGMLNACFPKHQDTLPEFSEREISIFRRAVQMGIVEGEKYKPPNGFKIHGFLIRLRQLQFRRYQEIIEAQRMETVELMAGTWLRNIEKTNGDISTAKEQMKRLWGHSEMDSNTRSIFNQSFLIAKKKWETTTKKNP